MCNRGVKRINIAVARNAVCSSQSLLLRGSNSIYAVGQCVTSGIDIKSRLLNFAHLGTEHLDRQDGTARTSFGSWGESRFNGKTYLAMRLGNSYQNRQDVVGSLGITIRKNRTVHLVTLGLPVYKQRLGTWMANLLRLQPCSPYKRSGIIPNLTDYGVYAIHGSKNELAVKQRLFAGKLFRRHLDIKKRRTAVS
jgi:hypothetical protein